MATSILKAIAKLKNYEQNPETSLGLNPSELAQVVIHTLGAVKTIERAIDSGQLDIGKTLKKQIDAEVKAGKSSIQAVVSKIDSVVAEGKSKTTKLNKDVEDAINLLNTKIESLENGKDAEVTEEHIRQAAVLASEMVALPDFDLMTQTAVTANGGAIRDALEVLQGDDRLSIDAISGTETWKQEFADLVKRGLVNGGGGFGPNTVLKMIQEHAGNGLVSENGWGYYQDGTYTESVPLAIDNARVQIEIDGAGSNTETGYSPSAGALWDTTNDKITMNSVGDSFTFRLDFKAKASANNSFFNLQLDIGDDSQIVIAQKTLQMVKGVNVEQVFSETLSGFALSTFITNGGKIFLDTSVDSVNLEVYDIGIVITKTT